MWSMEKMFNPSVMYEVLLMKQLHILFQMLKSSAEGVQKSKISQHCENVTLEAM